MKNPTIQSATAPARKKSYIEYDNNGYLVGLFNGVSYQDCAAPAHIIQLKTPIWEEIPVCCDLNYEGVVPDGVERF